MADLIEVLIEGVSINTLKNPGIEPDFCIGYCTCDKLVVCDGGVYICGCFSRCNIV